MTTTMIFSICLIEREDSFPEDVPIRLGDQVHRSDGSVREGANKRNLFIDGRVKHRQKKTISSGWVCLRMGFAEGVRLGHWDDVRT